VNRSGAKSADMFSTSEDAIFFSFADTFGGFFTASKSASRTSSSHSSDWSIITSPYARSVRSATSEVFSVWTSPTTRAERIVLLTR